MFPFSNHAEDEISILLDIGSGYIEGALLHISSTQIPHIIFERRVTISAKEERNIERTESLMLKALGELVEVLEKEGLHHLKFTRFGREKIRSIHCVLSSPWYISQTKIINVEKESPFAITPLVIHKMLEEENNSFKRSISRGDYSKDFEDTVSILESKIIRTKLNGYETAKPIGKSASTLELSVFFSIAGVDVVEKIKGVIKKTFNYKTLRFHSFPLVLFSGIRDISEFPHSFILLDVREEVTDVSLVKKGLLLETITIPFGTYFFARGLAKTLHTLPQVALSFLRLYSLHKTEPEVTAKIKAFLNEKQEWIYSFHEALKSFFKEFFLPKTVYISADLDMMSFLVDMLKKEKFSQFAGDDDSFLVIPVDGVLLKDLCKNEKSASSSSFLQIESIFLKKVLFE